MDLGFVATLLVEPSPRRRLQRRQLIGATVAARKEGRTQLVDPGAASDEIAERLMTFCREHLALQKCPRSVDFEAELPRLPTGKLYKRFLKDRYWADHKTRIL